jgi:hypothetical protein
MPNWICCGRRRWANHQHLFDHRAGNSDLAPPFDRLARELDEVSSVSLSAWSVEPASR